MLGRLFASTKPSPLHLSSPHDREREKRRHDSLLQPHSPLHANLDFDSDNAIRIIVAQDTGTTTDKIILFDSQQKDTSPSSPLRPENSHTNTHSTPRAFGHGHRSKNTSNTQLLSELMFGAIPLSFKGTTTKLHSLPPSSSNPGMRQVMITKLFTVTSIQSTTSTPGGSGMSGPHTSLGSSFGSHTQGDGFPFPRMTPLNPEHTRTRECSRRQSRDGSSVSLASSWRANMKEAAVEDMAFPSWAPTPGPVLCNKYLRRTSTETSLNGLGAAAGAGPAPPTPTAGLFPHQKRTTKSAMFAVGFIISFPAETGFHIVTDHWRVLRRAVHAFQRVVYDRVLQVLNAGPGSEEWLGLVMAASAVAAQGGRTPSACGHGRKKNPGLPPGVFTQDERIKHASDVFRRRVRDGLCVRAVVEVWRDPFSERIARMWMEELTWALEALDTRSTKFWFSTLVTSVLGTHLEWAETVDPHIRRKEGTFRAVSRTVVVWDDPIKARKVLHLLTMFVRLGRSSAFGAFPALEEMFGTGGEWPWPTNSLMSGPNLTGTGVMGGRRKGHRPSPLMVNTTSLATPASATPELSTSASPLMSPSPTSPTSPVSRRCDGSGKHHRGGWDIPRATPMYSRTFSSARPHSSGSVSSNSASMSLRDTLRRPESAGVGGGVAPGSFKAGSWLGSLMSWGTGTTISRRTSQTSVSGGTSWSSGQGIHPTLASQARTRSQESISEREVSALSNDVDELVLDTSEEVAEVEQIEDGKIDAVLLEDEGVVEVEMPATKGLFETEPAKVVEDDGKMPVRWAEGLPKKTTPGCATGTGTAIINYMDEFHPDYMVQAVPPSAELEVQILDALGEVGIEEDAAGLLQRVYANDSEDPRYQWREVGTVVLAERREWRVRKIRLERRRIKLPAGPQHWGDTINEENGEDVYEEDEEERVDEALMTFADDVICDALLQARDAWKEGKTTAVRCLAMVESAMHEMVKDAMTADARPVSIIPGSVEASIREAFV
ncbi:hypothetical protein G7K_1085-t1 [Saitoella complicata NRRL Y-17804]|uniref:UDENN FNIP1/2-type domain-containing protein n=1 Tax=Saitoella complicata (strain BCRC 22490 / CBS 7301 / JCM 7358 / NBRC 10748 / NRRL Y-17804) TaxID=698492 RepID=A0A0E9NAI6_SAICN|nr:hypothetical protein G7K_1085-t1 [Saitoella complicata NRRL Y-17804]